MSYSYPSDSNFHKGKNWACKDHGIIQVKKGERTWLNN